MKFRTELHLGPSNIDIGYDDQLLLLGSCFSENIGDKLQQLKYDVTVNPHGIIYHPYLVHRSIRRAIHNEKPDELYLNPDGQYISWHTHSKLSTTDREETLSNIMQADSQLHQSIGSANYIFLTYGTAYYYQHKSHGPVANCHKFPARDFIKLLASPQDITKDIEQTINDIKTINSGAQILLTVSPVRHIKDGIVENNRSKAHLLSAVHEVCDRLEYCYYLPSYELLIDDLRDYRYFADDMVHPSTQAIHYIWSKISEHLLDPAEEGLRTDILKLIRASTHRPFNPNSQQHQSFLRKQLEKVNAILMDHPHLNFDAELAIFKR